jgi:trimeric autotransporter adhesin
MTAAPDPATYGGAVTFTATVRNNGPNTAENVVLREPFGFGSSVASFTSSQGSCDDPPTADGVDVTCTFATIAPGASATVTVVVIPTAVGYVTATATATLTTYDPNRANNWIKAETRVDPAA